MKCSLEKRILFIPVYYLKKLNTIWVILYLTVTIKYSPTLHNMLTGKKIQNFRKRTNFNPHQKTFEVCSFQLKKNPQNRSV